LIPASREQHDGQVNQLEYGLTCSIWTNDLGTAHRAAVEAGFVWINDVSSASSARCSAATSSLAPDVRKASRSSSASRARSLCSAHSWRRARYSASGVGLAGGGSIPNVLAVRQVIEKLPVDATSATKPSSPIVSCAVA
jgi:Aldehyde dehydrogenase family